MPSVGSGRYSPGPGMVYLLVEVYQVIRTPLAICSLIRPGNPAIDSVFSNNLLDDSLWSSKNSPVWFPAIGPRSIRVAGRQPLQRSELPAATVGFEIAEMAFPSFCYNITLAYIISVSICNLL